MTSRPLSLILVALAALLFADGALAAGSKADAASGAVLYRDRGCARCHGARGEGTLKAPALVNIRKNKMWAPEKITQQIQNGGQKMPPFGDSLSDAEVAQIVTFLRSKHWPAAVQAAPSN
ncbi:MAG: cytochrome c [Terracidiphilus sp.]